MVTGMRFAGSKIGHFGIHCFGVDLRRGQSRQFSFVECSEVLNMICHCIRNVVGVVNRERIALKSLCIKRSNLGNILLIEFPHCICRVENKLLLL